MTNDERFRTDNSHRPPDRVRATGVAELLNIHLLHYFMYIYYSKYNKNITNTVTVNRVPARVRTQPYTPASDNASIMAYNYVTTTTITPEGRTRMTSRSFVLRYVFLFCLQWLFIYYTNLLILGIYLL